MTSQDLAELSNNAMYSATIVYVLAFMAHVIEWAMARDLTEVRSFARRRALVTTASQVGEPSDDPRLRDRRDGWPGSSDDEVERSDRLGRIGYSLTVLGLLVQLRRCRDAVVWRPSASRGAACTSSRSRARWPSRSPT